MKKSILLIAAVLLLSYCYSQNGSGLRKELSLLEPYIGKPWICESMSPMGTKLHFTRSYEIIHNGKVVKFHQECIELNIQSDGYFYFDSDKKEIAYLNLSSNGNFSVGNVKEEEGKLLFYGYTTFPNQKIEFREINEVKSKNEIADSFFSLEGGIWKAGHSRVWTVK